MSQNDARLALLQGWLARDLGLRPLRIERASSDASFRRYFRAVCPGGTFIVMDAPPVTEDVRPYLRVSRMLESIGIHVPRVHEADVERGLLLLEDLGGTHYLAELAAGGIPSGSITMRSRRSRPSSCAARRSPPSFRPMTARRSRASSSSCPSGSSSGI